MKIKIIGVLMAVCLLASCTAAEPADNPLPSASDEISRSAAPAPAVTPAPAATPKPEAEIIEEFETQTEQSIRDATHIHIANLLPEGEDPERLLIDLDNNTKSGWMLDIRDTVNSAVETAVAQAEESISAGTEISFTNQRTDASWQYLYILLLYEWEAPEAFEECIKDNLHIEVNAQSAGGRIRAAVSVEPVYFRDAIKSVTGGDVQEYFSAELVYAYMNTVFDERIGEKDYVLPPAEGSLAADLAWPLQRYTRLRKSWYAARDDGARKHTGTDIWAPEGAEIYSCTSGTVFFVGTTEKGGNVVVIMDDYGYFFEYCHMVCLSDFLQAGQRVEAGQLIGHVGNTGNSARNHLHITIESPDGILVNPYSYLREAKP